MRSEITLEGVRDIMTGLITNGGLVSQDRQKLVNALQRMWDNERIMEEIFGKADARQASAERIHDFATRLAMEAHLDQAAIQQWLAALRRQEGAQEIREDANSLMDGTQIG